MFGESSLLGGPAPLLAGSSSGGGGLPPTHPAASAPLDLMDLLGMDLGPGSGPGSVPQQQGGGPWVVGAHTQAEAGSQTVMVRSGVARRLCISSACFL